MVSAAVLCDPSRHPQQGGRCDRHVHLDRGGLFRTLARHLACPQRSISSALSDDFLAAHGGMARACLVRIEASGGCLCDRRERCRCLLLRSLPTVVTNNWTLGTALSGQRCRMGRGAQAPLKLKIREAYSMRFLRQLLLTCFMMLALVSAGAASCWSAALEQRLPMCLACHGENGTSVNTEVPSLGAQAAPYLEIQLYLFREGMRPVEVMNEAMKGIGDDELGKLAGLLSALPPPAATEPNDPARMEHARALVHQHRCDFCHNSDLSGRENVPRIAGQREDYLLKAMREYKSNNRPGYDASMADVVQPLTDEDIRELAYYAARQP